MINQQLLQTEIIINSGQTDQDNELLHEQTGAEITQPLLPHVDDSIADRFVRSHEIRLMPTLPEISDRLNFMTIITPQGLFQLNQETHTLKRLLDTDQLDQLGLSDFVEYSERSAPEEGTLIFDALTMNSVTLEQLRALERAVIDVGGYSVVGYSINASIWIKIMGYMFREQYPPKSNDYSRQWLELVQKSIFRDITLSLKVATFSFILYIHLSYLFFQDGAIHDAAFDNFFKNNIIWVVLSVGIFIILNMLLLRGDFLPKPKVISWLNRIRQTEQYMIAVLAILLSEIFSWMFLKIFNTVENIILIYLSVPLLILAIKLGFNSDDTLYTVPALNIFHRPRCQTFLNAIRYALTVSSFFSLGLTFLVLDILHFEQSSLDDDYPVRAQRYSIVAIIQFSTFIAVLLIHLMRYPYAPQFLQINGRYAGNISNAMGNVFLNSFSIMLIEYLLIDFFSAAIEKPLAWSQPWSQPVFIGLQAVIFMCSFMIEFLMTSNLPELSTEPVPPEKPWSEAISERIEPVTRCLQRSREVIASIELWDFFRTRQVAQVSDNSMVNPIHVKANETKEAVMEI